MSTNFTEEKRALFLPQEIKELPADDQLIFYEGCKPIRAKKNWYFKDRQFNERASMPPVAISTIVQTQDRSSRMERKQSKYAASRPTDKGRMQEPVR